MLPWMKKKSQGSPGVSVKIRPSDRPDEQPKEDAALESAAGMLLDAIEAKDRKSLAKAFRIAFDLLETEPHDEAEHEGPEMDQES